MAVTRRRLTNRSAGLDVGTRQTDRQVAPPTPIRRLPQGHNWYRIENHRQSSTATIYLYDEIGLWGITASDFVRELDALDAKAIDVHINSPGGDVFDGIAIYNALANHPAQVTTYVDGLAASAASFIAQAGNPVRIARNASMMIHDAEGICIGNCTAMLEMADLLDSASNNIADIYAQKSGSVAQWRERMKATTWYATGAEAVDAGLATEVYEPDDAGPDDKVASRLTSRAPTSIESKPAVTVTDPITASGVEIGSTSSTEFESVLSVELLRNAFTGAVVETYEAAPFDIEQFRLTMSTVASNCPAIADDEPKPAALPPMPTKVSSDTDTVPTLHPTGVIDSATMRQIMHDASNDAPAMPDEPAVMSVQVGEPVLSIDRAAFQRAIREGLM